MTIGLDGAAVERALGGGRLGCPAVGCGAVLGLWRSARERLVRRSGWLLPAQWPVSGMSRDAGAVAGECVAAPGGRGDGDDGGFQQTTADVAKGDALVSAS